MCDASDNNDDVYIDEIEFRGLSGAAGKLAKTNSMIPEGFTLSQNYPNPFNLSTSISFSMPASSEVNLTIYNIMGQKVKTLAKGWFEAGSHTVTWDGTNESGSVVASGIYFYKLNAGENLVVKKMSLLK
jgi:flagellar hook assembly protein FlgD